MGQSTRGIYEDSRWEQSIVQIQPGDFLILYTDGITDAVNVEYDNFGDLRLQSAVRAGLGQGPRQVQEGLIQAVAQFTGQVQQFDDMALVCVLREETPDELD